MSDLTETTKVLAYLAALYPHFKLTPETIHAYHDVLRDLPTDLLKTAARTIGSSNTFFPSASELRKAAFEIRARAQGLPSAAEAWTEVLAQVHEAGWYGVPSFSNDLVSRGVAALGGWKSLCASDNVVADRAHFLKLYDSLLERSRTESAMLPAVRQAIEQIAEGNRRRMLE